MDDERQPGLACSRDVIAEAALLRITRAVIVVIIEARLADRDDLRMARARDDGRRVELKLFVRVVWMRADRAVHIGEALGDREDVRVLLDAGRDRDHARHAGGLRARDNGVDLVGEIGEIEMAMAVDQHRRHQVCVLPSLST